MELRCDRRPRCIRRARASSWAVVTPFDWAAAPSAVPATRPLVPATTPLVPDKWRKRRSGHVRREFVHDTGGLQTSGVVTTCSRPRFLFQHGLFLQSNDLFVKVTRFNSVRWTRTLSCMYISCSTSSRLSSRTQSSRRYTPALGIPTERTVGTQIKTVHRDVPAPARRSAPPARSSKVEAAVRREMRAICRCSVRSATFVSRVLARLPRAVSTTALIASRACLQRGELGHLGGRVLG